LAACGTIGACSRWRPPTNARRSIADRRRR
jgi:hypothetical protein